MERANIVKFVVFVFVLGLTLAFGPSALDVVREMVDVAPVTSETAPVDSGVAPTSSQSL